jgi:endonuclease/exonuclease/phosphatase (EEP) superfamily protein YafD
VTETGNAAEKTLSDATRAAEPSLPVRIARWAGRLAVGILLLVTLAAYLGRLNAVFELASHFVPYYAGLAAVCIAWLAAFRAWRFVFAGVAAFVLAAAPVAPAYLPRTSPPVDERRISIKLLTINVEWPDGNDAEVFTYIAKSGADIVALQEINGKWLDKLSRLREVYPHTIELPRPEGYGVALMSRYPLRPVERSSENDLDKHAAAAVVNIRGAEVLVAAVHTFQQRPLQSAKRIDQMKTLGTWLDAFDPPKIVLGDLNVTPWSPHYRDFMKVTGLVSARKGFGIVPTFPTRTRPIMIPIDHVLTTPDIVVETCAAGEDVGSDHLPLTVQARLEAVETGGRERSGVAEDEGFGRHGDE